MQLANGDGVERPIGRPKQTRPWPFQQLDSRDLFKELFMLVVCGQMRHLRVSLGVIANHVPVAKLTDGGGAEVALHLADRKEGAVNVELLENAQHTI